MNYHIITTTAAVTLALTGCGDTRPAAPPQRPPGLA